MLDATKSRFPVVDIDDGYLASQENVVGSDQLTFRTVLQRFRQRRRMMTALTLVGAVVGWLAAVTYVAIRVPAFSASSEILISNTTLQLSGPEAVVTQVLLENSLIESAMELLRSGRVLDRVIDKLGLEEVERMSPKRFGLPWSGSSPETESSDIDRRRVAIARLRSNTVVKRVGASQIVEIRARAATAIDAARLTNEIAGAFVKDQYDANAVVTTNAALRERIKVLGPTARIISEAARPDSKDPPSAALAMLLALVLGGGLGAAGGVALVLLDRRLRSAEQLESVASAECFGYAPLINREPSQTGNIPAFSANHRWSAKGPALARRLREDVVRRIHRLGRLSAGCDFDLETILKRSLLRCIRSAVLERSTTAPRIVGVTSCRNGEGRTTIASMLARFLAQDGTPVLLIDASCADVTGGAAQVQSPGLDELLRGTATLAEVTLDNIHPDLDFLPRGKSHGDLDLLWNNLVQAINDGRERPYEWVILDLPPLSRAIDVRTASQILDELLIVVEWGRASEAELKQGLRVLGSLREKIVGTVINRTPWSSLDSETASLAQGEDAAEIIVDTKLPTTRHSYEQEKIG